MLPNFNEKLIDTNDFKELLCYYEFSSLFHYLLLYSNT